MSQTTDLLNLSLEANGIGAGITANDTAISAISVGNSTVNTTVSASVQYSNSTAYSNVGLFGLVTSAGSINLGNTTANSVINSTAHYTYANATNYVAINATTISVGNSTVNTSINATALSVGSNVATFGTAVYHIANGNVGIGTNAPTSLLHVQNSNNAILNLPSGTWAGKIVQAQDTSTYNGLVVGNRWAADESTAFEAGSLYGGGSAWGSYYKITGLGTHTWGGAVPAVEYMRLTTAGNVGISNTAPGSKFVVSSGISSFEAMIEKATVSATAATGNVHLDVLTQSVLYYTSNATANCTVNIRANSTVTANSILVNGQSLTVAFLNTTGATAYYPNVFSIDSTTVTPKWSGGTAPTGGNANSVDVYTYTIIKTANSTYTVLANQTQYK
jgi:hypothetical protein